MTPTKLLHTYIVFCKKLQLIIRWLRATLRPWGSCIPDVQILIGFWREIFIAYELDIPWNLGISSDFSRDDEPLSAIGALIDLPSFTVNLSQRLAPPPPSWSRYDVPVLLPWPPPWLDWDALWGELSLDRNEFLPLRWNDEDITLVFLCLTLFLTLIVTL